MRRGSRTKVEAAALALIAELNERLANRIFWEPSSRTTASARFDPLVVDIFYHDMRSETGDVMAIRDALIPLPRSADSAYRQVLLLGTTGARRSEQSGSQ